MKFVCHNFKASLRRTEELNRKTFLRGSGATYGLTKFSDMSPAEFQSKILMKRRSPTERSTAVHPTAGVLALPQTLDWRGKAATPVKDQEQCGSCWAFSATETLESAWMLAHNLTSATMTPLSPQQIVDCDDVDAGCNGGDTPTAYAYIMGAGGLDTAREYPYTAEDGTCKYKRPPFASMTNWAYATQDYNEPQMAQSAVTQGPLSVCLDAANWQDYTSGVMTAWECAWINTLDHCVQIVGYDLTASTPYWIVRNSWGTSWGVDGYIMLEYNANTCGIATEATYVISAK